MKRTLLLTALFVLLGVGAWVALNKKSQTGSRNAWDMQFAVPNTGDIHKIFLADRKGRTALLERNGDHWTYNGKARARPSAISTLLETIAKVNVMYVPTKASEKTMVKSLAGEGIKVEIYNKAGKLLKSYYVGGVTSNELGTYMMMEGSDQPYVTHIPSFVGQLRVRYLLGDDDWMDRTIFSEKPADIQAISVEYPQQRSESFLLEKTDEATYTVKPFFSATPANKNPLRKGVPEAYLLAFENKGAEGYETNNPLRDSVTALVPFAIVTVKKTDGEEKQVRFWPVEVQQTPEGMPYVHRYFAEVNQNSFLLIQEGVFAPVFRGYNFFFEGGPGARLRN
ncbi:MAG: DUF4340 domain-containing protein [Saprospiraceae bacterium]|nr:DUF4340 domain-containing protein [Saprospiraceae bacterium]